MTIDELNAGLADVSEKLELILQNQNALAENQVTGFRVSAALAGMIETLATGGDLDAEAIAALRQMAEHANSEQAGTAH